MTAMDTQALLATTMQKIASKKEEKKDEKKPPEKETVKGMDSCKYAMKVAEQLDYLLQYSEAWLGSPIERATKVAGSLEVPGILPHSKATGPDGKAINEKRDSMAVGEQPASTSTAAKGTFEGVPNMIDNTKDQRPGGSPEKPSDPPLYNKTAYQKVLSKLASNKVASDSVPNELRRMKDTDSGKGQSGYDSGSSHGNDKRSLVDTDNRKAMDYTKGDAKKSYIKEQLSQVFDEVHPEKDTALDRAFEHGVDGAKMAGFSGAMNALKDAGITPGRVAMGGLALHGAADLGKKTHEHFFGQGKTAGVEDAKKMKAMASKEVEEEKKEEKLFPGIHKKIEKEAGISDIAGKALGGLAGIGTKAHEAGKGALELGGKAINYTKEHPGRVASGVGAMAGLGALSYGADKLMEHTTDPLVDKLKGKIEESSGPINRFGIGANLGGLAGAMPGLMMMTHGNSPLLGAIPTVAGALAGAGGGQYLENKIRGLGQEKAAEEKCTCSGKGDCKVCKEKVTKLAYVLRAIKEAEQIPTNAPAGSTPDVTGQVAPQMEQSAMGQMGGEEDEIEKLKKMLLVMQMMKQQKLQEQMPAIDQAAPGAGSAADSTAAMSGPTTGAV
jgi:hypothetical protein